MSTPLRRALLLLRKRPSIVQARSFDSISCPDEEEDALERAAKRNEPRVIPPAEFFETAEEKERAARCRRSPLEGTADVSAVNGIPREYVLQRTARIYKESRHCAQNGWANADRWRLRFDTTRRFENPLMGWTSSSDALSNVQLEFATLAAAREYCRRNGFDYYVDLPPKSEAPVKSYGDNFAWNRRRRVSTK